MTPAFDWAVWAVVLPLFGAAAAIVGPLRLGAWIGLVVGFALVVCAGGLASHLWRFGAYRHDIGGWPAPLGIGLSVDGLAAVMIGITAVIGACVGLYGAAYFTPRAPDDPAQAAARALRGRYFWPLAMLLWAALDALFLAADLFNLYVTLELLSLSAVALVALAGGPSLAAAMRYLLVSMLGSLAWLLGVALVYGRFAALDLAQLQPLVRGDAALATPLALMIGGALFKTALFPLHFWLPPAHAGAPAPVSALLSAVVVKATFYLVLRLWLMAVPSGLAAAGDLLGWLGVAAILWGGVLALRQRHLKSMLAYSTVSQLGYLFLAFPLAKTPNYAAAVWPAAVLFIAAHALGKAALFLAAGNIIRALGHDRVDDLVGVAARIPVTLFTFGLAAVNLMGLPPGGAFLAKWILLTVAIEAGAWPLVVVLMAGGLLAVAYVARVLVTALMGPGGHPRIALPVAMQWSALTLALLGVVLAFTAPAVLALLDVGTPFDVPTRDFAHKGNSP